MHNQTFQKRFLPMQTYLRDAKHVEVLKSANTSPGAKIQ